MAEVTMSPRFGTTIARAWRGLLRTALAAGFLVVCVGQGMAQESGAQCDDERLTGATLGIGLYQCAGGACRLYRQSGYGFGHRFSVEPRVWELSNPARGRLKDGDILVAIDGALITTGSGGRKLANVQPGQSVELRIRRGKSEKTVRLTAGEGCEMSRLTQTTQIPPD
jgi:S1-C subfamily serine protease